MATTQIDYSITAKVTTYKGTNFRSRLEARWAAFFDMVGWDYVYEPSEIEGYNPDFILKSKSKEYPTQIFIVEVKPLIYLTDEIIHQLVSKYIDLPAHILILHDFPFTESKMNSGLVSLGFGIQRFDMEKRDTEVYDFEMKCVNDFGSAYMIFDGMMFGEVERKAFLDKQENADEIKLLKEFWGKAGSKVQFKIKKNKKNG